MASSLQPSSNNDFFTLNPNFWPSNSQMMYFFFKNLLKKTIISNLQSEGLLNVVLI